jgi:DNA-binding transcriptional LysR family regulator
MNPNQLLTFAVFARLKSVTRTAERLNLGQPAISGQLRQLQETVGEALYERQGHRIVLTPAGEGLREYAERLEHDLRDATDYVRRLREVSTGMLRLGSTMTIASYYLPRYMVRLQTQYPGLQVFMTTGNTEEIVDRLHELDLGFVEGPVDKEALLPCRCLLPWRKDEIVLIAREDHAIAREYVNGVPLDVFAHHQVIWREPGSGARQVVERALTEAGVHAPVHIEVTGVAGVKESVRAGLGIGFASSRALLNENAGLVARRINPPHGLFWQLNILAPEERLQSRAVRAFLALCAEPEES